MPDGDPVQELITELRQLSVHQQALIEELHHLYSNGNITHQGRYTNRETAIITARDRDGAEVKTGDNVRILTKGTGYHQRATVTAITKKTYTLRIKSTQQATRRKHNNVRKIKNTQQ